VAAAQERARDGQLHDTHAIIVAHRLGAVPIQAF
jgi:hypothetical protein